jgi:sulfite reductase alpha subunit-like flavoprotein
MARDVHDTLTYIIQECGGMDSAKAADYIKKLQNKGRYSCDVWS